MSVAAYAGALVLSALGGFGITFGGVTELELVAFGSAAFAAAHVLPR